MDSVMSYDSYLAHGEMEEYEQDVANGYKGTLAEWEDGCGLGAFLVQRAEWCEADQQGYDGSFEEWISGGREKWFAGEALNCVNYPDMDQVANEAVALLRRMVQENVRGEVSDYIHDRACELLDKIKRHG